MPGVLAVTCFLLPGLLAGHGLTTPLWVLLLVSTVQSAVFLALAVGVGAFLAPRVGLASPVIAALVTSCPLVPALRPQLAPALFGGILGGALLYILGRNTPATLAMHQGQLFSLPLVARVLYGGVTEELLCRWGLMSLFLWLVWRIFRHRTGGPGRGHVVLAIVASSLLFGAGHLPAVAVLVGPLSSSIVIFIVAGNAVYGLIAGYLFWQYGLESAILAHMLTHVLAYAVGR